MFLSIVLDTASGATIVLTAILGLILILSFKKIGAATRQRV